MQRRRLALLALLAVARERGLTRDKLVGYLWPDADPQRARRLLSDSVYRINQAVGGEALIAIGDELRINPKCLPTDVGEFADALERGDWSRAVELQSAPFLDGFFLTDADDLERWADAQRERLARERMRALEAVATAAESAGDATAAVRWWRLMAGEDPYNSRIALALVRSLARSGDRAAALREGQAHAKLLQEELSLAPDRELVAFLVGVQAPTREPTVTSGAASPASAAAPTPPPSVAVLPFEDLSTEPDTEYFADGITEDVIARLSRIGSLRVIARASVMRFRAREQGLRQIGAALGATTLLTGSVRRRADRVRVVAELVDAASDRCLWAETYDRRLTDVFAIQTDVALHIAEALRARLTPAVSSRIRREPTGDVEAYQLYLQGRYCLLRFTAEGLGQAIDHFERALRLDPSFATAHAGIALAYSELVNTGVPESEDLYRRARQAAAAALALDDELPEAHCMMGQVKAACDFDWAGAERAFRRALGLSPNSADTCDLSGRMCAGLERYDEAVALNRRALELDPLAHRADYATTLMRAGRHEEALEVARRAVDFAPYYDRARMTLGWALLLSDRSDEGVRELERGVALSPDNAVWKGQLVQGYARTGRVEEARTILGTLERLAGKQYVSPYALAFAYTGMGEADRAVECLERAYQERAGGLYAIKGSFLLAPIRSHPRFTALLARMNLA